MRSWSSRATAVTPGRSWRRSRSRRRLPAPAVSVEYRIGDVRALLAEMPAGSVDLICTSWPYLEQRDYLPPDDPMKLLEIGHEGTPEAYIRTLLGITAEFRRVLAPHGSIATELGDKFSDSGGAGGDYGPNGLR